ncbi:CDC42 small effector protein Spec2 isoform X2 [Rhodnius prolixus]
MSTYQSSNVGGDLWVQLFSCCLNQHAQVRRLRKPSDRRGRIDRSMIGEPTNFRHTAHIGSEDINDCPGASRLSAIENQMKSKGGYEATLSTIEAY